MATSRTGATNDTETTIGTITIASGLNILAAIWLFISPWVLPYAGNAGWNSTIVAVAIAAMAALRVFGAYKAAWLSWINVVLGIWLVIAPWVLNYEWDRARWNSVIVGLIVAAFGAWSASASGPAERRVVR